MATKKVTGTSKTATKKSTNTSTKKSTTRTTKSSTKSTNTSKSKGTTKSSGIKSAKNKTASTKGTKSTSTKSTARTSTKSTKSSTKSTSGTGNWVTINGVHVFIENGKVTKGPKNLIGKTRMQIKQGDYKNKEKQKKPITQTFKVKKETEYSGVLPYGYTSYHVYMTDDTRGESRIKEFETYKAAMDYVKDCRTRSAKGLRYYGGQWYQY